ncbi:MAG: C4-dicarboxylate ABC transporter, partial [Ostreibacterium sp.]
QIITSSLKEALTLGNKLSVEKAASDKQKIIDSGISKIHTLTDGQRQQWITVMKPVWEKFKDDIGADIIKAAVQSND